MEQQAGDAEIRRKPVGAGNYATLIPDGTFTSLTSAQVRDVSDLDILAASYNGRERFRHIDESSPSQRRAPPRAPPRDPSWDAAPRSSGLLHPASIPTSGRTTPKEKHPLSNEANITRSSISIDGRSTWSTTTTKVADDASSQGDKQKSSGHVSFYFSRLFLLGMASIFIMMIVSLEVLFVFSERNKGIVAVDEKNHYLWTYGPTFLLTLFVALWGQLEHRVKHLMPWLAMTNGPVDADQGFLLDYITPLTISSLYNSGKRKHFLVTLGILGSLTLRVLVIVSTGLLSVSQQTMVRDTNVTTLDQFNMSRRLIKFPVDTGVTLWGLTQKEISYPTGTTDNIAVQSIELSKNDIGNRISAPLVVFEPDLVNCSEFSWTYPTRNRFNTSISMLATEAERAIIEPYCITQNIDFGDRPIVDLKGGATLNLVAQLDRCAGRENDEEDSHRLYISMKSQLPDNITAVSAVLCHPSYKLTRRVVTLTAAPEEVGNIAGVDSEVIETIPLGVYPANITKIIMGSISSAAQRFGQFEPFQRPWFAVLNYTDPQPKWSDIADMSRLPGLWKRVYKMAAVQTVKYRETDSVNESVPGLLSYSSDRLNVEEASLRVMESLLALLAVISVAFCFFPFASLPTRSGFMLTLASILTRSPMLLQVLGGTGIMDKYAFRHRLAHFRYGLDSEVTSSDVKISVQPKKASILKYTRLRERPASYIDGWQPLAAGTTYKISLIGFTIAIVATLEALLQHSIKNEGLADVSIDGYMKYTWLFLPAITMAGIALSYSTVDITYRLLHPFQQLCQAEGPNLQAMKYDPLGKLTATAFLHALKSRYFALAAAMLTSLLGPILTIAASGLFSPSIVPGHQPIEVNLSGWFDFSSAPLNVSLYSSALNLSGVPDVVITQGIFFNNLSYPQGTYGEFTFPKMSVSLPQFQNKTGKVLNDTRLVARVPAARSQMNCSVLYSTKGQDYVHVQDINNAYFIFPVKSLPGCKAPENKNITADRSTLLLGNNFKRPRAGYFAWVLAPYWSLPVNMSSIQPGKVDYYGSFAACDDGLQHTFTAHGHQTGNITDYVTVMHCMPYVEAVTVEATFTLPNLRNPQDTLQKPSVVEGTAKRWNIGTDARYAVDPPPMKDLAQPDANIDQYYQAIVSGKDGTPIEELVGEENIEKMKERMNIVHQNLVTQALNEHHRSPPPAENVSANGFVPVVNGSIIDDSRMRLLQSAISTRILEGLLMTMVLCSIVVFYYSGPTNILPKNPGSIAGRMSLLADSTVLKHIADLTDPSVSEEYFKDRKGMVIIETEVGREELFSGDTFSLGWWHTEKGSSRYGIDLGMSDNSPRE